MRLKDFHCVNLAVPAFLISLVLLPIHLKYDHSVLDKSLLHESLKSVEFKVSCVAVLLVVIPVFVDLLLDCWAMTPSKQSARANYSWASRALICVSQLTMGITFVTLNGGFNDNSSFIPTSTFVLFHFSHRLIIAGCLAYNLCLCNPVIFPAWQTYIVTLAYSVSSVSAYLEVYLLDASFETINHVAYYTAMTIIQSFLSYWLYHLWRNRREKSVENYAGLLYVSVYLILMSGFLIAIFSNLLMKRLYYPLVKGTPLWVSYFMYAVAAYMMFLGIVPGRIARMETAAAKDKIIDTNKAYVRFISHEMRTPLNTVFMGLKVSLSQIPVNDLDLSPQERDRREVLEDTCQACDAVLEILNDLLLYDKLEDHMLVLSKQDTPVRELIMSTVNMFSVQLREKSIALTLNMQQSSISIIRPSDCIYVDQKKISQVLRNLLSNAIKFTQEGGSVYVTAYFDTSDVTHNAHLNESELWVAVNSSVQYATSTWQNVLRNFWKATVQRNTSDSDFYNRLRVDSADVDPSKYIVDIATENGNPVSAIEESGFLVVQVRDTGAGISPENQQRLFSEVIQFSPERLQGGGGSGLGLHISHEIVGMHGGQLQVHSEGEGLGSTFTLKLPMTRRLVAVMKTTSCDPLDIDFMSAQNPGQLTPGLTVSPASSCSLHSEHQDECSTKGAFTGTLSPRSYGSAYKSSSANSSPVEFLCLPPRSTVTDASFLHYTTNRSETKPLHVLIVDDSKMNRKMLAKSISHICSYEEAEDGQIALDLVRNRIGAYSCYQRDSEKLKDGKRPFDAILMDFMMPHMDGPTATREILEAGYQGLVIGVTGNAMQADIDHFLASGAVNVLIKPLDMTKLVQVFGNLLEPNRQR